MRHGSWRPGPVLDQLRFHSLHVRPERRIHERAEPDEPRERELEPSSLDDLGDYHGRHGDSLFAGVPAISTERTRQVKKSVLI
jgi:hypothetical protein